MLHSSHPDIEKERLRNHLSSRNLAKASYLNRFPSRFSFFQLRRFTDAPSKPSPSPSLSSASVESGKKSQETQQLLAEANEEKAALAKELKLTVSARTGKLSREVDMNFIDREGVTEG